MTYEITYFHIISLIYNAYLVKLSISLQDLGHIQYNPITYLGTIASAAKFVKTNYIKYTEVSLFFSSKNISKC